MPVVKNIFYFTYFQNEDEKYVDFLSNKIIENKTNF